MPIFLTSLIIFCAFILNAFAGFGGGIMAVPFLVFLYPLKFVSPFVNLLGFSGNIVLAKTFYKHVQYGILIPLVIGNIIGGLLGIHFLILASNAILIKVLGIVTITSSLLIFLADRKISLKPNIFIGGVAGVASGMLSAIFASGGAPIILYLSTIFKDKQSFRTTSLAFFLLNGVVFVVWLLVY